MSGRTQDQRLAALAARLSERDLAIVADVVRLRFLTAGQLSRLHFASIPQPVTRIRRVQRSLGRLVEHGLLTRCQRRVGGVRAGSASFTYAPTAEAIRLDDFRAGRGMARARGVSEPGTSFVDHTVAVNELFVAIIEAARSGRVELLEHQAEPDCWRSFLGPIGAAVRLRPDVFVALGVGEFEQRSFVEVDRGSEGSSALRRKLGTYIAYWRSGTEQQRHDVFPRVVWQVTTARRGAVMRQLIDELAVDTRRLFVVAETDQTFSCLCGTATAVGVQP